MLLKHLASMTHMGSVSTRFQSTLLVFTSDGQVTAMISTYCIKFPIWAIVDDATSKWLDAWIVPSNPMGEVIRYLFLCLVEKYGGKCPSIIQLCISNVLLQDSAAVKHQLWLRDYHLVWTHECIMVCECY